MPNIFNGLNKMDDEKLKYQIATLETVTISNIASEMGQKTKKKTIKFANAVRGIFSDEKFEEAKVVPIEERIEVRIKSLDKLDRSELDERLKNILLEKVRYSGTTVSSNPSNDEISALVIETAAKSFKKEIGQNLTPAQKADAVRHRYNEKLLEQTKKSLDKQTEEERRKTEEAIQKEIDSLSEKQQAELKEALGVNKLTGTAVRKMLTTAAGTTAAMVALEVSGFGAYMALTTIIHAIFTTTLGITLPFAAYTTATSTLAFITGPVGWITLAGVELFMLNKSKNKLIYELMAQIVWGSVEAYGKRFTPSDEELPSWLPDMERDLASKESAELLKIIKENKLLKEKHQNLESTIVQREETIRKYNTNIKELNERIAEENEKKPKIQQDIISLERKLSEAETLYNAKKAHIEEISRQNQEIGQAEKEKYEHLKKAYENSKSELEKKEKEIKVTEELICKSWQNIEEKQKQIEQLNTEVKEKEEHNEQLLEELNSSNEIVNMKIEKTARSLKQRWSQAFSKIEFDNSVYKYVSKNFEYNELGNIEARLVEMYGTEDPLSLRCNRGNMSDGRAHIEFSTPSGFPGRIFYIVDKEHYPGKTIVISEILKHNDPRYGK